MGTQSFPRPPFSCAIATIIVYLFIIVIIITMITIIVIIMGTSLFPDPPPPFARHQAGPGIQTIWRTALNKKYYLYFNLLYNSETYFG